MEQLLANQAMADQAVEAGARALLTFLEAEFTSEDVTRLPSPPASRLPGDAVYFRIGDDARVLGTVGATPDFLSAEVTTALVERLHRDDLSGAVRRAGAESCVMLEAGAGPTAIALG
jgi:hypothetical protein